MAVKSRVLERYVGKAYPLLAAGEAGDGEAITYLLDDPRYDLHARDKEGLTLLHKVACSGATNVLLSVIDKGVNLEGRTLDGWTALHICSMKEQAECALVLLNKGADVGAQSKHCLTPLHIAAWCGHTDVITVLLDKNADIDAQNVWGRTPLHAAVRNDSVNAALLLVEAGGSLIIKDKDGRIPLDHRKEGSELSNELVESALLKRKRRSGQMSDSTDVRPQPAHPVQSFPVAADSSSFDGALTTNQQTSIGHAECSASTNQTCPAGLLTSSGSQQSTKASDTLSFRTKSEGTCDTPESQGGQEWSPFRPFGSKASLMQTLGRMSHSNLQHDRIELLPGHVAGHNRIRYARDKQSNLRVVMKFYYDKGQFDNAKKCHQELKFSNYICKLSSTNETDGVLPPYHALEKGFETMKRWLVVKNPKPHAKLWCLSEVLIGMRHVHQHGMVHCDLKPENIVFFSKDVKWKLIDLDEMKNEEDDRPIRFTPAYAPPEINMAAAGRAERPVIRCSFDMWSFGVIFWETLTGRRFFSSTGCGECDFIEREVATLIEQGIVQRNLNEVTNVSVRHVLSNLLTIEPKLRWTAEQTLESDVFNVLE